MRHRLCQRQALAGIVTDNDIIDCVSQLRESSDHARQRYLIPICHFGFAEDRVQNLGIALGDLEDAALLLTARALLTAARIRTESRGCHRRTDFPATDDVAWRRSTSLRLDVSGQLIQSGTGIARTAA